jgi:RNA-binding motif X-linked protein 2
VCPSYSSVGKFIEFAWIDDDGASESSASSGPSIDPEDPMREYLLAQRREQKALKASKPKKLKKPKSKHKDETPEERRARKERKRERRANKATKSEGVRGVEALLASLTDGSRGVPKKRARSRSRSRTPELRHQGRSMHQSRFD